MSSPFPEHPLRHAISAELHARTFDPMCAPAQVAHLAYVCGDSGDGRQHRYLLRLLAHFGCQPPTEIGQQFATDIAGMRLRWERHTEFVTYTFTRCGALPGAKEDPFDEHLLNVLPPVWLRELPGEVVTAALLAMESRDMPERSLAEISALFNGNTVVGSLVAGGGGQVWSDLRIHPDGYSRVLVRDASLTEQQAGRLVKRLLEIKSYRAMALLGLPLAREIAVPLADAEARLATAAAHMVAVDTGNGIAPSTAAFERSRNSTAFAAARPRHLPETAAKVAAELHPATAERERKVAAEQPPPGNAPERALLADLTALAAEIESAAARSSSRFDASLAYYQVVLQRLEQLRQERIEGLQTFTEFLDARLAPAIATCTAAAHRQQGLAERAARLTALLRARVEVRLQEQNRTLLDSMDRRARLQLRLQETVEGLSVVAIGYYGVGLVAYVLNGLAGIGAPFDPVIAIALTAPVVVGLAWIGLHRIKRRIMKDA